MLKFTGFLFIIFISLHTKAQDSLSYNKIDKMVYQNNEILSSGDLFTLMRPHPVALKHLQASRDSPRFATPLAISGGFAIGFAVGTFLVKQKMPWPLLGAGAALLTGGILLHSRSFSQLRKAVDSYNSTIGLTSERKTPFEFSLAVNQYGLGMNFKF
jgi:hypothetical protein